MGSECGQGVASRREAKMTPFGLLSHGEEAFEEERNNKNNKNNNNNRLYPPRGFTGPAASHSGHPRRPRSKRTVPTKSVTEK